MAKAETYHLHIRVSSATKEKLDWLRERYSSNAQTIAVAIALLYQRERFTIHQPIDDRPLDSCPRCYRDSLVLATRPGTVDDTWFCIAGCGFLPGPERANYMPT